MGGKKENRITVTLPKPVLIELEDYRKFGMSKSTVILNALLAYFSSMDGQREKWDVLAREQLDYVPATKENVERAWRYVLEGETTENAVKKITQEERSRRAVNK